MSDAEFSELKASIAARGVREPVVIRDGMILDGRHRWKACQELGVDCPQVEWASSGSVLDFVVDANLHRRHLSTSQRAMVAVGLEPMYAAEATQRTRAPKQNPKEEVANLPPAGQGKSRERAAKQVNVSARLVQSAKRVATDAPKLAAEVVAGNITVHAAEKSLAAIPPAPPPLDSPDIDGMKRVFRKLIEQANELLAAIESVAGTPVGREIRLNHLQANIKNIGELLRFATPHVACVCGAQRICKACSGAGWVTREQSKRQGYATIGGK